MADFEHMADGYKAHLFQWDNEEPRHLRQCGCWVCDCKRQQRAWELKVAQGTVFHRHEPKITDSQYWGDCE